MIDLEIKDLEKRILSPDKKNVFDTFYYRKHTRLRSNKIYALTGPAKSGKSLFIRLLLRLNDPDRGTILLNGASIHTMDLFEYRQYFSGCLPGDIFFTHSAENEIAYTGMFNDEVPLANQKNRIFSLASLTIFPPEKMSQAPEKCSAEEKAKIKIARTIFGNADSFIFDETFDCLNPEEGKLILGNLRTICRQDEKLLVFASTKKEFISVADEIIELKQF
jgi:ABC-type lipoprotein export system ATPase subunit